MSKKAEKAAWKAYPNGIHFKGRLSRIGSHLIVSRNTINVVLRMTYQEGYEQAEKDLALTSDDVKLIIELYWIVSNKKEFPTLGDVFQEVARRFNELKQKRNEM